MNQEFINFTALNHLKLNQNLQDYKPSESSESFYFDLFFGFKVHCNYEWDARFKEYTAIDFDLVYKEKKIHCFEIDLDIEGADNLDSFIKTTIKLIRKFFDINEKDGLMINILRIENQIRHIDITSRDGGVSQNEIVRYFNGFNYTLNDSARDALKHFSKEEREGYFHDSIFDCRTNRYFQSVFDTFQEVGHLQLESKSKVFIHESYIFNDLYYNLYNTEY